MDKLNQVQETVAQAARAIEELEAAIDRGDQRTIGARLYELQIAIKKLEILATIGGE